LPAEITVNGDLVKAVPPSDKEGDAQSPKKCAEKTASFFHRSTRLFSGFDGTVIPAIRQFHGNFFPALTVGEIRDYH